MFIIIYYTKCLPCGRIWNVAILNHRKPKGLQIEILITTSNTHTIRSLETDRDSFQASYCYVIGALPASQDMFPVPFNEGFHLLMVCFNLDPHGLRHFLDKGIVFLIPAAVKAKCPRCGRCQERKEKNPVFFFGQIREGCQGKDGHSIIVIH